MIWFRLEACLKCEGDLALDNGDWICLQCGTYYYTGLYQSPPASVPPDQDVELTGDKDKSLAGRQMSAAISSFPLPKTQADLP